MNDDAAEVEAARENAYLSGVRDGRKLERERIKSSATPELDIAAKTKSLKAPGGAAATNYTPEADVRADERERVARAIEAERDRGEWDWDYAEDDIETFDIAIRIARTEPS